MLQVKHQRPDQRRHCRYSIPLELSICGDVVHCTDWSAGGFRVDRNPHWNLAETFELSINCGMALPVRVMAQVVRDEPGGSLAAKFVALPPQIEELLREFGGDTPTSSLLPSSVTPISTVPDEREAPPSRKAALLTKRMFMFAAYGVLSLLAILTVHFARESRESILVQARVSREGFRVRLPADQDIEYSFIKTGEYVRKGQLLARIRVQKPETLLKMIGAFTAYRKVVLENGDAIAQSNAEHHLNILRARLASPHSALENTNIYADVSGRFFPDLEPAYDSTSGSQIMRNIVSATISNRESLALCLDLGQRAETLLNGKRRVLKTSWIGKSGLPSADGKTRPTNIHLEFEDLSSDEDANLSQGQVLPLWMPRRCSDPSTPAIKSAPAGHRVSTSMDHRPSTLSAEAAAGRHLFLVE